MLSVIITITYRFSGTIRRFAVPERFNNRKLAEKAAQQLIRTNYLDGGVNRVVTHAAEIVEVRHV